MYLEQSAHQQPISSTLTLGSPDPDGTGLTRAESGHMASLTAADTSDFIRDGSEGVGGDVGAWESQGQGMAMTRTHTVGTMGDRNIGGSVVGYWYTLQQEKTGCQGCSGVAKSDFWSRIMTVAFGAGMCGKCQWQGGSLGGGCVAGWWPSNGQKLEENMEGN
ncbi:hypothetical protein EDC04DRAFT_2611057 [Pisolithus marmoratus]|nr:hypothetical protein EDC04DRAFT_2611057 [Pisolithus marmoratus]